MNCESQLKKLYEHLGKSEAHVSEVLNRLDLSYLTRNYRCKVFSAESLGKLQLYKRIKGFTHPEAILKLQDSPEEAVELGFFHGVEGNIVLPSKGTLNQFLKNIDKLSLELIAEQVLRLATEKGIVLDIKLVEEAKKRINRPNCSVEFHKAVKLMKKLIYPQIDLIKTAQNATFTSKDLLDVLVFMAENNNFANSSSVMFKDLYPERKIPSGDTLMYHFAKIESLNQVRSVSERVLDFLLRFAEKNHPSLLKGEVDVAVDIHKIPYYGDKNDAYVLESQHDRGTTSFYAFLTCSIVTAGKRFVVATEPIHPFDSLPNLLNSMLAKVKNKVRIRRIYLDRGFDNAKTINVLKNQDLQFLMPKIKTDTVKAWFDKSEDCPARTIKDFLIGKGDNQAKANLILVDDEQGIKRSFITNMNIPPQLAHRLYEMYGKRWGIETCYRNLDHDFKPKTTSKNHLIRMFYFFFTITLYNLWVLVNICVSVAIYGRIKQKPIITAKRFAIALYRVYVDVG